MSWEIYETATKSLSRLDGCEVQVHSHQNADHTKVCKLWNVDRTERSIARIVENSTMNKIIIAFAALIAVASAASLKGEPGVLTEWETFKSVHNKSYTEAEENFRFNIFLATKGGVETHKTTSSSHSEENWINGQILS
ncbi:hypothetical protein HA402_000253 [Bradysia odoriphaga]|nr:hypothetical protein HA402_000253 [Bradysia odoriphaga]